MKNSSDIRNRTCDIQACGSVPQPTAPPRVQITFYISRILTAAWRLAVGILLGSTRKCLEHMHTNYITKDTCKF